MNEKVLLALVAVVVGWVLAQGTSIIKDFFAARRLKRGLLEELKDLRSQLQRTAMICARMLQIFALRGCEPSVPLTLQNLYFKQYYKDVFHKLNREQRLSYQLIHASIDNLNKQFDGVAGYIRKCVELKGPLNQALLNGAINDWGEAVDALFRNVRDIQWHIEYHLTNQERPDLQLLGPTHAEYLKFQEAVRKEVATIISEGRRLKREDFEKLFDEAAFSKPPTEA